MGREGGMEEGGREGEGHRAYEGKHRGDPKVAFTYENIAEEYLLGDCVF